MERDGDVWSKGTPPIIQGAGHSRDKGLQVMLTERIMSQPVIPPKRPRWDLHCA